MKKPNKTHSTIRTTIKAKALVKAKKPAKVASRTTRRTSTTVKARATYDPHSFVRIVPIGGLGEIGLNCMVIESRHEAIIIDCGVMFTDLQNFGVDFYIPDFSYLESIREKIKGYVITHAHEDHIGALPYALRVVNAPIYCTDFAKRLIGSKLVEHELYESTTFSIYKPGDRIAFKELSIEPVWVNHSIIEATALVIGTPQGKIVHTGDFKFDVSPFYGKPLDPKPFRDAGKQGVRLLLSDSTNVERDGCSKSEKTLVPQFEKILKDAKGLTLIAVFASNVARVGQILEIVRKQGKKIAFLGRSMEQNSRLAAEAGYLKGLNEALIPMEAIADYPRHQVVVLSTGSQGEYRSGLARVSQREHRFIKLQKLDTVVMSSKFIPGNEKAIGIMINNLFRQEAEVIYEPIANVHVSGHATSEELARMISFTQPEFFVPVHGEYRHLVRHRQLAIENGIAPSNALLSVNGDILELTSAGLTRIDHFEEKRTMIEGDSGTQITKLTLKDRRKVAESGVVFAIVVRNISTGKLLLDPAIISRGVFDSEANPLLHEESKEEVLKIVEYTLGRMLRQEKAIDLQEEVRVGLRRFFNQRLGKKPIVLPLLIEI